MYNYRQPYENELYHYGILGQKWGVRRYQNADGSYTNAGKERYNAPQAFQTDQYARRVSSRANGSMGSSGIHWSWGGGYLTPKWVTNRRAYSTIDRAMEWLTGNMHETALNTVLNTGYGNQNAQEYILRNVYGYSTEQIYEEVIPETYIPEDIIVEDFVQETMDEEVDEARLHRREPEESIAVQSYVQNKQTVDAIVEDYRKHTLPGLVDTAIDKGRAVVNTVISWLTRK